jgi:hypothetical protein
MVRDWFTTCVQMHTKCRKTISGIKVDDLKRGNLLPTRLIEVELDTGTQAKLVETGGQYGQYVALSYRWGKPPALELQVENYKELKKKIPVKKLPKTIRDALIITSKLGIKHIWVDSMCIIQNEPDKADWKREARQMGDIYQRATLTIAPLTNPHSSTS